MMLYMLIGDDNVMTIIISIVGHEHVLFPLTLPMFSQNGRWLFCASHMESIWHKASTNKITETLNVCIHSYYISISHATRKTTGFHSTYAFPWNAANVPL